MQESIKMKEIFFSQTLFVYPCFTANKKKRFEFNMEDVKKKKNQQQHNNNGTFSYFCVELNEPSFSVLCTTQSCL